MQNVITEIKLNWKAGLSVALVNIPLSISLAIASGTSPSVGVVTAIWAGLVAAIFGGSNFNIVGPAGALSGILAGYALVFGPGVLPVLALLTGIIVLFVWFFRWDRYIVFIPSSVIHGFTLSVALVIGFGQLNSAFGLTNLPKHENFLQNLAETFRNLSSASLPTVGLFLIGLSMMFALLKFAPKIPNSVIVALFGIVIGYASFAGMLPFAFETIGSRFGDISLNLFSIPKFSLDMFSVGVLKAAPLVAIIVVLETLLSAKIADGMTKTKYKQKKEVLVFVHELGHFLAARRFGIRVDEFAIGFPPKIISRKWGKTEYSLNLLPIGGYVKIYGENAEDVKTDDNLLSKPKWQQIVVLAGGVTFNIIFAWLLLSLALMVGTKTSTQNFPQEYVKNQSIMISNVNPGSPAEIAGLKAGDELFNVTSPGGVLATTSLSIANIQNLIANSGGTLNVTYKPLKTEEVQTVRIDPTEGIVDGRRAIGIAMTEVGTVQTGFFSGLYYGAKQTYYLTINVVVGLFQFFKDILVGQPNFDEVAGPVGIANVVGDASRIGIASLITITAVISVNLAVINLLPFPALDGGRIVLVLVEAIRRRPLSPVITNYINIAGFALLILLMIVVTFKDIFKLFR